MFKPSIGQAALAMVWIYEGLWCKLAGGAARHAAIVASVSFLGLAAARVVLAGLGAAECALGLWVLSARRPRGAAIAQTSLLAAMNAGGIVWARREIPDIPGMLLLNFSFLVL